MQSRADFLHCFIFEFFDQDRPEVAVHLVELLILDTLKLWVAVRLVDLLDPLYRACRRVLLLLLVNPLFCDCLELRKDLSTMSWSRLVEGIPHFEVP